MVVILLLAAFLGGLAVVFLFSASACPSGFILKGTRCCQDFNNDNRCDIISSMAQAPQTIIINEQDPQEIARLQAQIRALQDQLERERMRQTQVEGRTYCDSYGCYRIYDGRKIYISYRDRYRDDDEWDLTVVVKDEDTGDRLGDARVRVENDDEETEWTDEDGEARFRNLEEDCYDIRVSKSGYDPEHDDICLTRDRKVTIRLEED